MKTLFTIRKAATAMPLLLLLSASVVLVPGLWSQSQLKLIQPDLVRQGETFTGRVVEQTAADDVPLESGHVIFQGQVIPIEPGGRITLPAFVKEVGNTFVVAQVTRALAGNPSSTVTRHVEVVPVASNVPTRIAQASPILNPSGEVWGTGQGLKMAKAALVDQSGTQHDLGELFGSSLQVGGIVPHNLPSGTYHFVAWDAAGNRYEAPNASKCPTVELTGPRITHRGQTGEIIIRSDTDGSVVLSGGEPQIQLQLDQVTIPVRANQPAHVKFTAQQVGDYKVNGRLITPEGSSVLPDALKVDTTLEPLQTHYDPSRNQTQASIGMQVVDEAGHPVANAPVDIAVAHPNGVEYSRAVTNQQGHASFTQTFAGQLAADALSAHVYRVLGHPWKQDAECDCEDLTVKFDVRYDPKGRNNAGVAAEVSKDRKKKDTINVNLAVAYLAELKCEDKDNIGHCEGQIDVGVKSEWIHKPPEGVSLDKQIGDETGKGFGVDPKGWSTISPDTESSGPKPIKVKAKCNDKKHVLNGKVVYTASFSAGSKDLRGKVTITLTPICNGKPGKSVKMTVFVDGTSKSGFDPDKSDYDGDGKANKDKAKPGK